LRGEAGETFGANLNRLKVRQGRSNEQRELLIKKVSFG
jgi:hypothetical protein